MKNDKLLYISVIVLTALSVTNNAKGGAREPVGVLDLNQAISLVMESNPEIQSAQLELKAAEYRMLQAGLRPNPNLSFQAENVLGKNELSGFDSAEYTAQLEQTLEIGGKRSKRVESAELNRQLRVFNFTARQLDVEAETVRRFTALQGAQEQLALDREFMSLAQEFQKAVAARVQAGKVSAMEEEKAKILLSKQKAVLFKAENELASARVRLSSMWGSSKPGFDSVSGDFFSIPLLRAMSDLVEGVKENPDVGRWKAELAQRNAGVKAEKAARLPDVTIAGGVRRFNDTGDNAFVLGLSLPLPLFDRNQGNVLQSATLVSIAEKEQYSANLAANTELEKAYHEFLSASNKVSTLKIEIIPRATTVYDSVKAGYVQGKFSYLDVLDAQRTLFEARGEYIDAMVACRSAAADIGRISGKRTK